MCFHCRILQFSERECARAEGYLRRAETLCKRVLEISPGEKTGHSLLSYAANGACFDWCSGNHRELIDYYYGFVKKNPDIRAGYMWLLDNLLTIAIVTALAVICAFVGYMFFRRKKHH